MWAFRDSLNRFELSHLAVQIEEASKPSLYWVAGRETEEFCSRLGGRPNLPANFD